VVALVVLAAAPARGESALALLAPDPPGTFRGVIHDRDGRAIGVNVVQNLQRENGRFYLRSEASIDGGYGNLLEAELEPIPGNEERLRPVWQRTRLPTRVGAEHMELYVDHAAQRARCERAGAPAQEIALEARERIANVAMNVALRPLAAGDVEAVRFQMLLCEGWKRVVDVEARRQGEPGRAAVEMRLGFDLGSRLVSALLAPFLPDVRVWLRPEPPNEWIAHRLPLYRGGPTIAIVREGIAPAPFLPPRRAGRGRAFIGTTFSFVLRARPTGAGEEAQRGEQAEEAPDHPLRLLTLLDVSAGSP
jgi:hypothetical protein